MVIRCKGLLHPRGYLNSTANGADKSPTSSDFLKIGNQLEHLIINIPTVNDWLNIQVLAHKIEEGCYQT